MSEVTQILIKFDVDPDRGFLPSSDPILKLPTKYDAWEDLAENLTAYLNAGTFRQRIEVLPVIADPYFISSLELERAMLLLSFFAHAYVHGPEVPVKHIPPSIAIPWVKVADELGKKPILSHSSVVLNNWRRLDDTRPIQLDNLATLCQFEGSSDESWFYLVTVEIERVGARAIPLILESMRHASEKNYAAAAGSLQEANPILRNLTEVLLKMYSSCDPHVFYTHVRPYLASFEDIDYRGTDLELQSHHGGSAAQSSLLQFFDAAFGIEYENPSTKEYLKLMRLHMPPKHAQFLRYIEDTSTIRQAAESSLILKSVYKASIEHLVSFRNEHLKMVALYIMKQAKESQSQAVGTGGTSPMTFLKSVKKQNEQLL